jgi:hypothetical protein
MADSLVGIPHPPPQIELSNFATPPRTTSNQQDLSGKENCFYIEIFEFKTNIFLIFIVLSLSFIVD